MLAKMITAVQLIPYRTFSDDYTLTGHLKAHFVQMKQDRIIRI